MTTVSTSYSEELLRSEELSLHAQELQVADPSGNDSNNDIHTVTILDPARKVHYANLLWDLAS